MNLYGLTLFLVFLLDDLVTCLKVNEGSEAGLGGNMAGKAEGKHTVMKGRKKHGRTTSATTTKTTTMPTAAAAAAAATTTSHSIFLAAVSSTTTSTSAATSSSSSSSSSNSATTTSAAKQHKRPTTKMTTIVAATTAAATATASATASQQSPTTTKPPLAVNLPPLASKTQIMNSLKANHDRNQVPFRDRPTEVQLGIFVTNIYSISEQTMDFSLSMYFRQAWRDPRLSYNHDEANNNKIRLMDESWNYFWVPDTYFRNEKSASFHKVTVNNRLINVNSSGHVWYVMRLTITLTCPMRLEMFPFDFQKCPIQFESFTNTMNDMFFGFLPKPVDLPDEIKPPQFQLLYYELVDCSSNYTSGAYPCAEISFTLQRDIGYYVIQVFIPSVLVVILSWVSFWINIDGVPARCTLGLLTVLTITSATSSVNATLPRVSYIKAIDVWLIMCLIFVFCALLEYAFVNVAARNGVRIRTPIVRKAPLEVSPQPPAENLPPKTLPKPQMQTSASSYSYKQVCIDSDEGTDQEFNSPDEPLLSKCWQRMKEHFPQQQQSQPPPSSSSSDQRRRNQKEQKFRNSQSEQQEYQTTVDIEASKLKARKIDRMSRKIFPFVFLVFIVTYWMATCIPSTGIDMEKKEEYAKLKA